MKKFISFFEEIGLSDLASVGGKNSSLGEMYNQLSSKGIKVPYGFATTAEAYRKFISENNAEERISDLLSQLDTKNFSNLKEIGLKIRSLLLHAVLPEDLKSELLEAYRELSEVYDSLNTDVAVRSSATAEDLPGASFAGQHDSFLNISNNAELLSAVQKCFISLFNDRAIKYREDKGFDHIRIAISVGVQKMVRSDLACSGVAFTLEPESGFQDIIHVAGTWGLGENIVQGTITPDEFYLFKPTLREGKNALVNKRLGTKAKTLVYATDTDHILGAHLSNLDTDLAHQEEFVLSDEEILKIGRWSLMIEDHYHKPMDIEWAKDGINEEIYIIQARPETVHGKVQKLKFLEYRLKHKGKILCTGSAVGSKISTGIARILRSTADSDRLKDGEILIAEITNPDWDPIMKRASAIVTNKGGRTSHAAIVARELGAVAVVGTGNATNVISDGQVITVSCAEGKTGNIYDGQLDWEEISVDVSNTKMPVTKPMMILGDPDKAFKLAQYPNAGVGLMRLEFIINNAIRIHPMALVHFDELMDIQAKEEIEKLTHHYSQKEKYFVEKLSNAVATIACAFYPKDVIVRMSDFKSNEYANLIGGREFELQEENPMIGFRGASRYYNERYKEGFRLECEAMKKVRDEMGLTNVKLMIPFCRTVEEGKKVVDLMADYGLERGKNSLEIYVMVEIPSNVISADEFAKIFDGFSIGSNDLTQLTLGIDRDSTIISDLFSEQNPAVTKLISDAISAAKRNNIKIGLCGQAPSDHPDFAEFLVGQCIDSISFNPDALIRGIENINKAEEKFALIPYS